MELPLPHSFSKPTASFRTPPLPVIRLPRPVAMPVWRAHAVPPEDCVVVRIGPPRRPTVGTHGAPAVRRLHSYGAHGASALCGASNWEELVPPDEATCPACRARLGRNATVRVH